MTTLVDYCILKYPPTLTVTSGSQGGPIYGQIYQQGVTDQNHNGPAAGLTAELGWGPMGSDPSMNAPGWTWVSTTFNVNTGTGMNNNEFKGTLCAPQVSSMTTLSYVYRFSLDGGMSWAYCDTAGSGSNSGLDHFNPSLMGTLTITP